MEYILSMQSLIYVAPLALLHCVQCQALVDPFINGLQCITVGSLYDWMQCNTVLYTTPDSKVYVANMWPIWGRQDPGGPHGKENWFSYFNITTV